VSADGAEALDIEPIGGPVDATVTVPGSKSITNRALMVAALARGTSHLSGVLDADDTAAMTDCLRLLGAQIDLDPGSATMVVTGMSGTPRAPRAGEDLVLPSRLSGTTSRFLLAACALGAGPYTVDGLPPLRVRPMGDGLEALRALGVSVTDADGHLPATIAGPPARGGQIKVAGAASSQFLSGLAMAGACMPDGLRVTVPGPLVSEPYVTMTTAVIGAFGGSAEWRGDSAGGGTLEVAPGGYDGAEFAVEPDASTASYFLAAAAICGGRVRVAGLTKASLQGDVVFAEVLERMGATLTWHSDGVEVRSTGHLRGISVDLSDLSDTAPTLAAVAVFADGPTEVTGVGFIRHKETDRIGAVVTELQRLGVQAQATDDGFIVHPGPVHPASVATYDDHRMAMAFSLIGLRVPGVRILDPQCVAKTFPGFFRSLTTLRPPAGDPR
jgi:3-phosphoshikimate 1-carboxyvinyltransferase